MNASGKVPYQHSFSLPSSVLLLTMLISVTLSTPTFSSFAATYTIPRVLNAGDIYQLTRDGWYAPAGGSAYEGDVIPKIDANDDVGRDNPYFRRFNVARAWPTDTGYWFTFSNQNEGEPDPVGPQWVYYVPPFEILGLGCYAIEASYRWGSARASYPAVYLVHHALGTNEILQDQRTGSPNSSIFWFPLGEFEMRSGSFVRVEDTGAESITFGNMRFRFIAPVPRLHISTSNRVAILSWPTNASSYHLQSTTNLEVPTMWQMVSGAPTEDAGDFRVSFPIIDRPRYFRLATP